MIERDKAGVAGNGGPSDTQIERATPRVAGGREVRVGLFVLAGALGFLLVLFILTDPALFRGRYMVMTQVEDAGGIRRGDPVQMRGVNIGRVHQFDMVPEGVAITLEIEGRWEIPNDSRALLAGTDLLGGRTVQIQPGESSVPLRSGEMLPGDAREGVFEMADAVGDEVLGTMEQMRRLIDDATIASVQGSVEELGALLDTLSEAAREQREELAQLTASLSRSAERVEDLTGREELDRSLARADSTLAELQVTSGNLANATNSLGTILERIERGEGTLGRLSVDDDLYENMTRTLDEIQALTQDIQENPGRYIRLRIF